MNLENIKSGQVMAEKKDKHVANVVWPSPDGNR